jgi:4,5-DOPA dioxygenase extradiol
MDRLPTLFLSHGAPDLPIQERPVTQFLRSLSAQFPKPRAILVISAHWLTARPRVSKALQPKTIHDFSGFPSALYDLQYPAPGAPELADRVAELIDGCELHPTRGLDHGTWTPLMLAYPEADIPVTQLSIQPDQDPTYHWQLGQALAPLLNEGVLIIGSGSATHNFAAFGTEYEAPVPQWVQIFDEWLAQTIASGDWSALLDYRQRAPFAIENHPTEEHLLPLFVALGAGGTIVQGTQLHRGYSYGAFSMAAYAFREESPN